MKIKGLSQDQIQKILQCISLHLPKVKVFAFGSRIKGTSQKYSDLDLALDAGHSIDLSILTKIKQALSETNIPFLIDIVDYRSIHKDFKSLIDKQKIRIK